MMRREGYLRVGEAADLLGVAPNRVRSWGQAGKIPEYRHPVNNYRLYKRAERGRPPGGLRGGDGGGGPGAGRWGGSWTRGGGGGGARPPRPGCHSRQAGRPAACHPEVKPPWH